MCVRYVKKKPYQWKEDLCLPKDNSGYVCVVETILRLLWGSKWYIISLYFFSLRMVYPRVNFLICKCEHILKLKYPGKHSVSSGPAFIFVIVFLHDDCFTARLKKKTLFYSSFQKRGV